MVSRKNSAHRWAAYFTPEDVGDQLVNWLNIDEPLTVVDICAGGGALLRAAAKRWPDAQLNGNDIELGASKASPIIHWSCQDGRDYALANHSRGQGYDLVIANPPFGKTSGQISQRLLRIVKTEERRLIASHRMECSMTVAAALLVTPGGALATIVPNTLIWGETFASLRCWMRRLFTDFNTMPLVRGKFRHQDLGLSFLSARRRWSADDSLAQSAPSRSNCRGPGWVQVRRGHLISSQTHKRGKAYVLHAAGKYEDHCYTLRRCRVADARQERAVWVRRGDVVVARVGRRAGEPAVYLDDQAAILTDCMFKLVPSSRKVAQLLRREVRSGRLRSEARAAVRGLGAAFCAQRRLATIVTTLVGAVV